MVKEQESAVKAVRLERLVGNIGHVRLHYLIFWLPLASLFPTYNYSFPLARCLPLPGPGDRQLTAAAAPPPPG